jgi:hypothetical protein
MDPTKRANVYKGLPFLVEACDSQLPVHQGLITMAGRRMFLLCDEARKAQLLQGLMFRPMNRPTRSAEDATGKVERMKDQAKKGVAHVCAYRNLEAFLPLPRTWNFNLTDAPLFRWKPMADGAASQGSSRVWRGLGWSW